MINPRVLLLVVIATMMPSSAAAEDCPTFECLNDSTCAESAADFGNHPAGLDFQLEVERDGKHCACPPGFTGLRCGTPYENCNDGLHKCYNGGQCIPGLVDIYGNDQLYCDCGSAVDLDGNRYAGKYCENVAIDVCDAEHDIFCVHGGTCKEDFKGSPQRPCRCHDPTRDGPHCEFIAGQVPECDLDCKNDGHCVLGIAKLEDAKEGFKDLWKSDTNAMYCECPEGFAGPTCESTVEPCGNQHCFHGSKCIKVDSAVPVAIGSYCDCTHADGDYAGRYCESRAEDTCRSGYHVDGSFFCVNGGTCATVAGGGAPICICPPGFYGVKCEYADDDEEPFTDDEPGEELIYTDDEPGFVDDWFEPTLTYSECDSSKCKNGGICNKGAKDTSAALDKFQNDHGNSANFMNIAKYDNNFEHCICPDGYMGLDCSQEVDVCGQNSVGKMLMCFFGSSCIYDANAIPLGCDCEDAHTKFTNYAGQFCEHKHTEVCTTNGQANGFAFCVNEGTCKSMVDFASGDHPGCDCKLGFSGPHCEIVAKMPTSSKRNKGGMIAGIVLALIAVILFGEVYFQRRRQGKEMDTGEKNEDEHSVPTVESIDHSFTVDGPAAIVDDNNIAPMSNVEII